MFFAAWFLVAGRVAWPQAWAFLLVFLISVSTLTWRLSRTDPALLRERSQPPDKAEPWDRLVMRIYAALLLVLLVIVALDGGRFRWSVVPPWAQSIGWVLLAICGTVIWHVTTKNPLSLPLRPDSKMTGDTPSCAMACMATCATRCTLVSSCCSVGCRSCSARGTRYIPSMVIVGLFVYRTRREDRMLHEGLAGYADYAQDVRYRLVPGIW